MAEEIETETSEVEKKEDVETEEKSEVETEEDKKDHSQPDYEAELKAEKERADKAEKAAADAAFKLREQRRKEVETGETEEDEDKPLTRKDLEAIRSETREQLRKEVMSDTIAEKARRLARSDAEANLIVEIHKNRTFPVGLSLDEQIEEAYAIANRKKILAENAELKRALLGKETKSDNPAGTHRDSQTGSEPKLSSADAEAYRGAGFVWDGAKRLYKKSLGKNLFLYKDPKTGKTWKQ